MDDLKTILLAILKRLEESSAFSALILADVESLKLVLAVAHPEAAELLQKTLSANRDRYAEESARIRAELELLHATVSKWVQ